MKIRICPNCGTHNQVDHWSCRSCGESLSINSVVDLDEDQVKLDSVEEVESTPMEQQLPKDTEHPQSIQEEKQEQRPVWVTAAALWFGLLGVVGSWTSLQRMGQLSQINWARAASQAGSEEEVFRTLTTIFVYSTLTVSIGFLVTSIGTWRMKKWATVILILIAVLQVFGTYQTSLTRKLEFADFFGVILDAIVAVGLVTLWRKGKLS